MTKKPRTWVAYPGYLLDAAERLFWTAASLAAGAFLAFATTGDPWSWRTFAFAVAVNAAKLVAARQVGGKTARALPGHHDEIASSVVRGTGNLPPLTDTGTVTTFDETGSAPAGTPTRPGR